MITGFAPDMTTTRRFEAFREPSDVQNGVITLWIHDDAGHGEKVKPDVAAFTGSLLASHTVHMAGIPPSGRLRVTKDLHIRENNGAVTLWIISQSTGDQTYDGYEITVNTRDFVRELQGSGIQINW
ncbi:MAG: hypothetical protein QM703_10420 [Gemmatales bacterium]